MREEMKPNQVKIDAKTDASLREMMAEIRANSEKFEVL